MKSVFVIRHVHFEDLGIFEGIVKSHGFSVRYLEAGVDDLEAAYQQGCDLLVALGGPIGAYQEHVYPFLSSELRILESRFSSGLPTLGICLGAQLMARALGARVYPGPVKELGWKPLALTREGCQSSLAHLAAKNTSVLHWHGDTFDLPDGATLLASTKDYSNQAFAWSDAALALQFHPEVMASKIERWLIGHACELSAPGMPALGQLRADTGRHHAALERFASAFFNEWLGKAGLLASSRN